MHCSCIRLFFLFVIKPKTKQNFFVSCSSEYRQTQKTVSEHWILTTTLGKKCKIITNSSSGKMAEELNQSEPKFFFFKNALLNELDVPLP